MARIYAGTTITLSVNVTVSDVLTDAPQVYFKWKMGLYGTETSVTPTHDGTGLYEVSITPLEGGDLYYRWDTEGTLDVAQEGVLNIAGTQFTL
jgi:hypothetical protein